MLRTPAMGAFLLIALTAYFGPRLAKGPGSGGATSALEFDAPHWDFGRVLEGRSAEHTFRGTNPTDQAIRITSVQHCGCLRLQYPEGPIPPNGTFDVTAVLDSTHRSGRLIKPIDLETDEPGSTKARLSSVGFVDSPMLFRRAQIVIKDTRPGQRTEHQVRGVLDSRASQPRVQGTEGAFLGKPALEQSGDDDLLLTVALQTPDRSATGEIALACEFEGATWTLRIPVRVVVVVALTPWPRQLRLKPGDQRNLRIQNSLPKECTPGPVTVDPPEAVVVRELERTDDLLRLEVERPADRAAPAGPVTLSVTTGNPDHPTLVIPVEFLE